MGSRSQLSLLFLAGYLRASTGKYRSLGFSLASGMTGEGVWLPVTGSTVRLGRSAGEQPGVGVGVGRGGSMVLGGVASLVWGSMLLGWGAEGIEESGVSSSFCILASKSSSKAGSQAATVLRISALFKARTEMAFLRTRLMGIERSMLVNHTNYLERAFI